MLATQQVTDTGAQTHVILTHWEASGAAVRTSYLTGFWPGVVRDAEFDVVGADMGLEDPYANLELYQPPDETNPQPTAYSNPTRPGTGCTNNGIPVPCSELMDYINSRAGGVASYSTNVETEMSIRYFAGAVGFGRDGGSFIDKDGIAVERVETHLFEIWKYGVARFNGYMGGGVETFSYVRKPVPPQTQEQIFYDKYLRCVDEVFGGPTRDAPTRAALPIIIGVAAMEGVEPALLAVTWRFESGFNLNPPNNPNDGSPGNADIGPAQINYRTWHNSPLLNGLDDVFGTARAVREIFNGNPLSSLRATARILNHHGSGRTAAGRYRTGTGDFSRTRRGISEFNLRAGLYDRFAPLYDAFFRCMR